MVFLRIGKHRCLPLLAKFETVLQNLVRALDNGDQSIKVA